MAFDIKNHTLSREPEDVTLQVGDEEVGIKIKGMPWSRKRQLASLHVKWDSDGNTIFDGAGYINECLKYMIVEAPWGATNDVFLATIDDELGIALEALVPKAFGTKKASDTPSAKTVKKE